MATIRPFKAWRPVREEAHALSSVPYDIINTEEARSLYRTHAEEFLKVVRPEITTPEQEDIYSDSVYEAGRKNLYELLNSDRMVQDSIPRLYAYRLIQEEHEQLGVFGCVSVEEYDRNIILKHELTRPAKENDRTRHIHTQHAHAEPVMMAFEDNAGIEDMLRKSLQHAEMVADFTHSDGVQHTIWKLDEFDDLAKAFRQVPNLYIADGHHRCAAASRVAKEFPENEEAQVFPAVLFPVRMLQILAYNRVLIHTDPSLIHHLLAVEGIEKTTKKTPDKPGDICLYVKSEWYTISLPQTQSDTIDRTLDVARLQEYILEPILGIVDQRSDPGIDFVGGIRGTEELERMVDQGEASAGISMYPTSMKELVEVSEAGLLMPPKSTWFEPKLRSGLLIHTF
ncbi:MAG: DUF1015 family protein [Bacteroidota bacterium]